MQATAKQMHKSIATVEGAEAWAESMMSVARHNFEEAGELMPIAAFLMTKHPETRTDLPEPQVAFLPLVGDTLAPENKDKLAEFMRMFAERSASIGYVMCMEAWYLEAPTKAAMSRHGDLSVHPKRQEALLCTFEHAAFEGTRMWKANILRDKDQKPTLAEFETYGKSMQSEGRFVGVLPRKAGVALA